MNLDRVKRKWLAVIVSGESLASEISFLLHAIKVLICTNGIITYSIGNITTKQEKGRYMMPRAAMN